MVINLAEEIKKGLLHYHAGQVDSAKKICEKIICANPEHSEALNLLGIIEIEYEHFDIAIELLNKAVKIFPEQPAYWDSLGSAYRKTGAFEDAVLCYEKIIQMNPLYAKAYIELGNIFFECKMLKGAAAYYETAAKLNSDSLELYDNLGKIYVELGDEHKAISSYEKIIQINPDIGEVFFCLGVLSYKIGAIEKSIKYYKKAVKILPEYYDAYNNLGNVYAFIGYYQEAAKCFKKGINVAPDKSDCYCNLANFYVLNGEIDKAIEVFNKALNLKPDIDNVRSMLAQLYYQICAWKEAQDEVVIIKNLIANRLQKKKIVANITPFFSMVISDDNSFNFSIAKIWAKNIADIDSGVVNTDNFRKYRFHSVKKNKKKIILGYLSSDFKKHATSHLLLNLFKLHNRDEFKILCYSYGDDDKSYYRKKIIDDSDEFIDLRFSGNLESARRIYRDKVDILVDLKGYTMSNRLGICAYRPAPVQISYLGFPGTTGADFIDYIITDKIVTPLEHEVFFSEKFIYMPDCYQINDRWQPVSDIIPSKDDFGLPADKFIFCSFNAPYKIEPVMFDLWMRILKQVPKSVLWLIRTSESMEKNIKSEAAKRGVEPERIILADKIPKAEHLARLKLADLVLDTRIVNGHTTTSDALWTGTPVITLLGKHFASRVSSSILSALGLPELITKTLSEYEDLAVSLAIDPGKMGKIRFKLGKNRLTYPLFDTPMFVKYLENNYKEVWKIFQNGENVRHIGLSDHT